MPHEYAWKHDGTSPSVRPPSGCHSLELPAVPGSLDDGSYPVQGTFRLEYKYEDMDMQSRLWRCSARLLNFKDGMQSCAWHRDDIMEEPGVPVRDTVMKAYLDWARIERERASAMFVLVQKAWDSLHPDEFPDHP